MSIRQVMNEKPVVAIVVVVAVVGAAVWMGLRSTLPPQFKDAVYFTDDDGKTWFADKPTTVTPYTKDGKEVVRAHVYQCKDGKPYVAYLTRQNPAAAVAPPANLPTGMTMPSRPPDMMTIEFKRPGDKSWEMFGKMSNATRANIKTACPDGSDPEKVNP